MRGQRIPTNSKVNIRPLFISSNVCMLTRKLSYITISLNLIVFTHFPELLPGQKLDSLLSLAAADFLSSLFFHFGVQFVCCFFFSGR